MIDQKIDLTNCDREPIHIPGNIQPHGFLLAINAKEVICYCSDNISMLTGMAGSELLGRELAVFALAITQEGIGSPLSAMISLYHAGHTVDQLNPSILNIFGQDHNLILSTSGDYLVMEIEPAIPGLQGILQKNIGYSLSKMLVDKDLDHLISSTAKQVRAVIGFDRVMIYRFAADGHGEVIAESRADKLDSWIGQHFPASDIPLQARELYKKNLTRLIANVGDSPSMIIQLAGLERLDLTNAQLRAVSPIHIEYLKNMQVVSSFSISLIYKSELWGLIACHHYSPRFIDFEARASAKLMGQILSSALEFRQDELNHQLNDHFNLQLDKLSKYMLAGERLIDALCENGTNLLSVTNAAGAVLYMDNKVTTLGTVPEGPALESLFDWVRAQGSGQLFFTDRLESLFPEAHRYRDIAAGMMMVVLSRELGEHILFFKPERLETISWAGNPNIEQDRKSGDFSHISPRNSFELWAETVNGRSEQWTGEEVQSVTRLAMEITYARNLRANALRLLNDKLTLAYEELDTFSYSISHDLKNPISSVKIYAQLLSRDPGLSDRSREISEKIHGGAERMNSMVVELLEYSRLGRLTPNYKYIQTRVLISTLCEEIMHIYHVNPPEITFGELHPIYADPVLMNRVFANLIGNAAKYSQLTGFPEIHISSRIVSGKVCLTIRDNGIGIKPMDLPRIFDLFSRMSNVGEIEGSGVGLAIVKRIMDRHNAEIWAESTDKGTVFYLILASPMELAEEIYLAEALR